MKSSEKIFAVNKDCLGARSILSGIGARATLVVGLRYSRRFDTKVRDPGNGCGRMVGWHTSPVARTCIKADGFARKIAAEAALWRRIKQKYTCGSS